MTMILRRRLLSTVFCTAALHASAQEPGKAVEAFAHRPQKEQESIAAALRAELDALADPALAAQRALAAARVPGQPRTKTFPHRDAGKHAPKPGEPRDTDLALRAQYVFGLGIVEEHSPAPDPKKPQHAAWEAEQRSHLLHAALVGVLPDADRTLAELQRQLDRDPSADRFVAFLEAWRNGDESFYEALDRTAGTKDSVFFYDLMLHDFTAEFAADDSTAPLNSLVAAHDALHAAFLAYRQYRGFREAFAYSIVLPPDVPLPHRLQRYEQKVAGSYSLREQVVMMLAVNDWDPRALLTQITDTADRLPTPLWKAGYDPYPRWNELYAAAVPAMVAAAEDTDAWLRRAQAHLQQNADAIRSAAQRAVGAKAQAR